MTDAYCDKCSLWMTKGQRAADVDIAILVKSTLTAHGATMIIRKGQRYICPKCKHGIVCDFGDEIETGNARLGE